MKQFAVGLAESVKCSELPHTEGGEWEGLGGGKGVAKSNHTVITGLTRRAEEQIQCTLRIRTGATWSFFMPHENDNHEDDNEDDDDYKS